MSSPDRFICPACRMFCGLISPDGRLPQAPECPTENCPAVAALKFNRLETAATATIDRAIAARKRRAADADEPTPAEAAVPETVCCNGEIGVTMGSTITVTIL